MLTINVLQENVEQSPSAVLLQARGAGEGAYSTFSFFKGLSIALKVGFPLIEGAKLDSISCPSIGWAAIAFPSQAWERVLILLRS